MALPPVKSIPTTKEWEVLTREIGRVSPQVPHVDIVFVPNPTKKLSSGIAAWIANGWVGWKAFNHKKLGILSPNPTNPKTGRDISCYLSLTPAFITKYENELWHAFLASSFVKDAFAKLPSKALFIRGLKQTAQYEKSKATLKELNSLTNPYFNIY